MKKALLLLFTLIMSLTAFTLTAFINTRSANAEWIGFDSSETYEFGSVYDLPEVKINVNGNSYDAKTTLEFPDGNATSQKKVTLDQSGIYKLTCSCVVDSKTYTEIKTFRVEAPYYVYGNGSYAEYGSTNAAFVEKGLQSYSYKAPAGKEFLFVTLNQGDTLTFNEYIDVTKLSKSTEDPFIESFVLPSVVGVYDFDFLYFTLTDSLNPDITLTFLANRVTSNAAWARMTTYVMAYGNGQPPTGAEYNGKNILKIHVSDGWGTAHNHSFVKQTGGDDPVEFDPSTQPIRFWFDYNDNSVLTKTYGNYQAVVCDLDDPEFFGSLWKGFPSGKAKLSVTAESFNGSRKANFVIAGVQGLDLSKALFADTNAPTITVNTEYDYKAMPEGKLNHIYPIPTAIAKDDYDGIRKVRTSVYFNYGTPYQYNVDIKDSSFVPKEKGTYAIVYSATDKNGNVGKTVLFVHVGSNIDDISINIPEDKMTNVTLGYTLDIPTPEVLGGTGYKNLKTEVVFNGERYEITNGKFSPETAGTYRVEYTATDYIGDRMVNSYEVTTNNGDKSLFIDEIVFPKVLAADQKYIIPTYYLNNYTEGSLKRVLAQVKISDRNGTKVYNAGDTYIPQIIGSSKDVKIEFFDETTSYEFIVNCFVPFTQKSPTVAAQVAFDKYFSSKEFLKEKSKAGLVFTLKKAEEVASFVFANDIVARAFRLDLKAFSGSFDRIEFLLEDINNPLNVVKATLIKNGVNGIFVVGDTSIPVSGIFASDGFSIGFNQNNEFTLGNAAIKAVLEGGFEFKGFSSEKCYITANFYNMSADASFVLNRICKHTLSSASTDTFAPEIIAFGNYGGTYTKNDTYTINPALSFDCFAINVNFTLNVLTPSKEYAKDVNGVELKDVDPFNTYVLDLTEFGQYIVTYRSVEVDFGPENMAQSNVLRYVVNVIDKEAPVISVGDVESEYTVGDFISVPAFTVSDNKTEEAAIKTAVYFYTSDGALIKTEKNYIEATKAGTYEIRIMAIDEAGNITLKKIKVTVKEAK